MTSIALARHAMATRFEIVLHGDDPHALRAAGEEALDEIARVESLLSAFRPDSDIGRINGRGATEWVRVTPETLRLLQRAVALGRATDGAFDVTAGPLLRCWGFVDGRGQVPAPAVLRAARAAVGGEKLAFDEGAGAVRFAQPGMRLDLGALGKGYALDCAAALLLEAGVTRAFLHGGTSTSRAVGAPPGAEAWRVAVDGPAPFLEAASVPADPQAAPLTVMALRDASLSVSAVWGRSFEVAGRVYGHLMDPHSGEPVQRATLAAVVLPSAADTDALSTALLVLGRAGLDRIAAGWPDARMLVLLAADGRGRGECVMRGIA